MGARVAVIPVHAHRGGRGLKPENTLPAFETALDLGVAVLEADLHFTADDQVVVWHDPFIRADKCRLDDATTEPRAPAPNEEGTEEPTAQIRRLTLAQVQRYQCDRNPDSSAYPRQNALPTPLAGGDYRIVTLDALLAFVATYQDSPDKARWQREAAGRVRFNLETKRRLEQPETIDDGFDGLTAGPFERAVLASLDRARARDRTILQSFDHRSLWAMRAIAPDLRFSALTRVVPPSFEELAERGASIWSPRHTLVTADSLTAAHRAGLEVIPWTVNERAEIDALLELGVDALITDYPDRLQARR